MEVADGLCDGKLVPRRPSLQSGFSFMQRIAHIVQKMAPGGLEVLTLELARQAPGEHIIISLEGEAETLIAAWPRLTPMRGRIFGMKKKPGVDLTLPLRLAALLRAEKICCVVTHHVGPMIYGGAAARLASLQASQLEIDNLLDLEEAVEGHANDPAELGRLNRMFHEAMFRAAHNRYLNNALEDLQDFIGLLGPTTFGVAGRPELAFGEHRAIVAAIVARQPDEAEGQARRHIREALRTRMKLLRE